MKDKKSKFSLKSELRSRSTNFKPMARGMRSPRQVGNRRRRTRRDNFKKETAYQDRAHGEDFKDVSGAV